MKPTENQMKTIVSTIVKEVDKIDNRKRSKKAQVMIDNKKLILKAINEGIDIDKIASMYNIPIEQAEGYAKMNIQDIEGLTKTKTERQDKHGLTSCGICVARTAYFLQRGGTFKELEAKIHNNHPNIKNVRRYTQRFIRYVTGNGEYDDWIVAHQDKMWQCRAPVLWENESEAFRTYWKEKKGMSTPLEYFDSLAKQGKKIYGIVQKSVGKERTEKEQDLVESLYLSLKLAGVVDKNF